MTELVPRCETDKKIPSLFWQEEDRDIKDEKNRIRLDPKEKEEVLRRHWQEIFKFQLEDNIEFVEGKEQMLNQHIRRHLKEFQEEETIELDWDNVPISSLTT